MSCVSCQSCGDRYDADLLRPDEAGFAFEHYFVYDYFRNRIEVNGQATSADQRRADVTIRLFRWNEDGSPEARRIAIDRWHKTKPDERVLGDFNFRYLLDVWRFINLPPQ